MPTTNGKKVSKPLLISGAIISVLVWMQNTSRATAQVSSSVSAIPGYTASIFTTNPPGASNPDSITVGRNNVFVGYGDGHAPDGSDGLSTTIAQYSLTGQLLNTFNVQGHNDGLRINPADGQLWALSNEDTNPLLTIINPKTGAQTQYNFSQPTPHGGGYDDLAFLNGQIFISGSNPNTSPATTQNPNGINTGPALYTLKLPSSAGGTVQVTPILSGSASLPLTDPDSLGILPGGVLTLDGQQDQQLALISNPGTSNQTVKTLNLPTQVDDTVSAPGNDNFLLVAQTVKSDTPDGGKGAIYKITGNFTPGAIYAAENQQNAVGILDPNTGNITPIVTGILSPHGLGFVSIPKTVPEPNSVYGILTLSLLGVGSLLKRRLKAV